MRNLSGNVHVCVCVHLFTRRERIVQDRFALCLKSEIANAAISSESRLNWLLIEFYI